MFQKVKSVPEFSRRGQFVADSRGHGLLSAAFHRAYRMKDAAARNATLTQLVATCRERGYHFETVYDAEHGRRYLAVLFLYSVASDPDIRQRENLGARKMAFDFITAPEHERYNAHAP